MLIYKINISLLTLFSLLIYIIVGVARRGVPDADRQKYRQTDEVLDLRQELANKAFSVPICVH